MNDSHYFTELGERIKYLRKQKGMRQLDLSVDSGIPLSKMGAIEQGKHNPTLKTLITISRALGVELKELFN